ncbi:MAG: hypothetical protein K9N52_02350 [Verrucomicrobia bacterium]|nr:hypothetical protein [Verrucomicrobiota bacterium]
MALLTAGISVAADEVVEWDFTQGMHGWRDNNMVEPLFLTEEGLVVKCTGNDPWIEGPSVDCPPAGRYKVDIRMKSDADASAELFYGRGFSAGRSVRFNVFNDGEWHDYSVLVRERLGAGVRFRLDPAQSPGRVVVSAIRIESIKAMAKPEFAAPVIYGSEPVVSSVKSGDAEIRFHEKHPGAFSVRLGERVLAQGYREELIGIKTGDTVEWLSLGDAEFRRERLSTGRDEIGSENSSANGGVVFTANLKDSEGAEWEFTRRFIPRPDISAIEVVGGVQVDRERKVVLLPWLTLFPGHGSFGSDKRQGLFAGLEYLADEPSSSTADIDTPEHIRRVPDPIKITFPLMAVENKGAYIGLVWDKSPMVAAGFDSPDRVFGSGAHAMFLTGPGVGEYRFENSLAADAPFTLPAGERITSRAWIILGEGDSLVEAARHYLKIKPLPDLPVFEGGFDRAVELLAHGWLDSTINEDWRFRHAVWGDAFRPAPAADAAAFMDSLSLYADDANETLSSRLNNGVEKALGVLASVDPYSSSVSHVRPPFPPLVFGRVAEFIQLRREQAYSQLERFDAEGKLIYRSGSTDYGKTHFADHANGLTGRALADVLEAATLTGDKKLRRRALTLLDKQSALYANTVPRGAQTWEVPLHTPDILASAHMLKAYLCGYALTGKERYLEQARYWAWTGVPFVYLENPTGGECGAYATIAVLGATNWKAPVWFGQPVQWCGLVYGSALYDLAEIDETGPWSRIAKGITLAGLQMVWDESDAERQGLLPDYFLLRAQVSDGPAINPGTVQARLLDAYNAGAVRDIKRLPNGWLLHAPCKIRRIREDGGEIHVSLDGWGSRTYRALISGVDEKPSGIFNSDSVVRTDFEEALKLVVLTLKGKADLVIKNR